MGVLHCNAATLQCSTARSRHSYKLLLFQIISKMQLVVVVLLAAVVTKGSANSCDQWQGTFKFVSGTSCDSSILDFKAGHKIMVGGNEVGMWEVIPAKRQTKIEAATATAKYEIYFKDDKCSNMVSEGYIKCGEAEWTIMQVTRKHHDHHRVQRDIMFENFDTTKPPIDSFDSSESYTTDHPVESGATEADFWANFT